MTSEVTQADRDAAAPFAIGFGYIDGYSFSDSHLIRNGRKDDHALVQAFARHRLTAQSGEGQEHYTVAMERRPKEIGGVKVGPGLYRIHWKSGGSSLAAIGMCANGAWWIAPTNWVEPATPFRIDEDPEGRTSWHSIEALERIEPPQSGVGRALPWLSKLLRYHETGGHEGDGSDHAKRNARTELDAIVSGEGRSGAGEPWPGCYADLHERRVTTLAKLGIMLSLMVRGESWLEAVEAVGYETSELYAEVLMALAIEDADDTDIALEEARDHPEHDCLAALNARQSGEGEREKFLTAYVSEDCKIIGIEHDSDADWHKVHDAHIALWNRLEERIRDREKCPRKPALRATDDAGGA